ncbi:hypothetical protein ACFFIX_26175 [Metabacillus herbersteinensis]|uniref:Phage protein n=2 Tax=Metabacillus herbersteinensis TaxID=283816 RepID=A0ABV6GM78_9BACI
MIELIGFMIEDTENLLVKVEKKLNDPLYNKDDLQSMAIVTIKIHEELLDLKYDQDVLDDPNLVPRNT